MTPPPNNQGEATVMPSREGQQVAGNRQLVALRLQALLQEGQNGRWRLVGLCQHGGRGLLDDLTFGQGGRGRRVVGIFHSTARRGGLLRNHC